MKRAFITGIEGQDGSYLADLLLSKNYQVHGTFRPGGSLGNLDHLTAAPEIFQKALFLYAADLDDASSLGLALAQAAPDDLYHLASQSQVGVSFEKVEETCRITGLGTLRLLELARKLAQPPRFFHASSSEIFGSPEHSPQDETTPVAPITPYGCAKEFGTQMTRIYRKNFGLFAVNGILFNHESPRRGENFVTRKITQAVARIKAGLQEKLFMGNIEAKRDWGYAKEYVEAMWRMLQQPQGDDYVVATGETHSVREFLQHAFDHVGLDWQKHVEIDPKFYRPAEVEQLIGNPEKARQQLQWEPQTKFADLVRLMVDADTTLLAESRKSYLRV